MTLRPYAILETVLYTDDLEATSEFYTSIMNLTLIREDSRMRVLGVSDGNFLLLFKTGATIKPVLVDGGTIPAHDGKGGADVAFMVHPSEVVMWSK